MQSFKSCTPVNLDIGISDRMAFVARPIFFAPSTQFVRGPIDDML